MNLHVSDVKMPAGVPALYEDNFAVVGVVAQEAEEVKADDAPAAAAPAKAAPAKAAPAK